MTSRFLVSPVVALVLSDSDDDETFVLSNGRFFRSMVLPRPRDKLVIAALSGYPEWKSLTVYAIRIKTK